MKLRRLQTPIEETVREGLSVIVSQVGTGRNGLTSARVAVWNGVPLAADVIRLDVAAERQRVVRAALAADETLASDEPSILAAMLRCAEAFAQFDPLDLVDDPLDLADDSAADNENTMRFSANFPELVDIVASAEDCSPRFLVLDKDAPLGVQIVEAWKTPAGVVIPPPKDKLPWLLPREDWVLRYLGSDAAKDSRLFSGVVALIKKHALLPEGSANFPDAWAELVAAFVFHTHYMEAAAYSPELAFYAPPERGKSRTGRTIAMARRGVHTETLREANLFRDSQDRGATLFIDCTGLWTKASKLGCEDILLNRFERGAKVSRVLYPERGPFADTVYFDIFGPTILASNEPLGRVLDTRCVQIDMPWPRTLSTQSPMSKLSFRYGSGSSPGGLSS
jgi:hypothetical protein